MTLIVYRAGAMYADDCFVIENRTWQQRREKGQKLFLTPCKRVAVAVFGQTFAPTDADLIVKVVGAAAIHNEWKHMSNHKDVPPFETTDHIFNGGNTHFMLMTRYNLYELDLKSGLVLLPERYHHLGGTGGPAFNVCMNAGLSVEEAYKVVARVVHTVGDLAQTIYQKDLTEIKPFGEPVVMGEPNG
jgi:hypothetical protein